MRPLATAAQICDKHACPAPAQRTLLVYGQDFYFCGHHSADVERALTVTAPRSWMPVAENRAEARPACRAAPPHRSRRSARHNSADRAGRLSHMGRTCVRRWAARRRARGAIGGLAVLQRESLTAVRVGPIGDRASRRESKGPCPTEATDPADRRGRRACSKVWVQGPHRVSTHLREVMTWPD
jgi:hypothetical protein